MVRETITRLLRKLDPCEDVHLTRFLQYKSLRNWYQTVESKGHKVASISGSLALCGFMGIEDQQIKRLDYPEFDLLALPFADKTFDMLVADQVLEHVEGMPHSVFREAARVLPSGGYFVNATVMTYPLHFGPKDLWRFTPEGHAALFDEAGFSIVHQGSWGGNDAVIAVARGMGLARVPKRRQSKIRRLAESVGHEWPVVIWAVGKRN
jgi:SAM-dependent methyltransferase